MDEQVTGTLSASELENLIREFGQEIPEPDSLEDAIQPQEPQENHIAANSPTLLVNEYTLRFSSASWFEFLSQREITIAGLGGIGSWTAMLVARLNPIRMLIYDPDKVGQVNIAGQLYRTSQINENKVSSISSNIQNFCSYYSISSFPRNFDSSSLISPIAICGFDNMEARKTFYKRWKTLFGGESRSLFIDGRLAAEEFQVFSFTGKDKYFMNKYESEWLFNDSEAEETSCSYKQTSYCAAMIASVMTNILVNFAANLEAGDYIRELPFMTSYDAGTMTLNNLS